MEDRYEIRGKIGQGGLGSVYRGYDTRMSREIAIKRITMGDGTDKALEEESTKQLIKEAGALASLQHPHIVTIFDVGVDEDGPYVVMELLSGKTLEELVSDAPLTWSDFRELALQTQEAIIAAHELDLIHSDIKPSNLMLTWLPSGKFQIKMVDFGLATVTRTQNAEDLKELEAVFGSIFFMPPEQFERKPLDARSDLYSMGCVYYHALAGVYPFNGSTGNEVMEAHLAHTVTPLHDIRADIPIWACEWIMWMINRQPDDRPASARECLSVFLQNDKNPDPTMSLGTAPQEPNQPKRPRLIIPGAQPQAPAQTAAPAATQPAETQPEAPKIQKPQLVVPGTTPAVETPPVATQPEIQPEPAAAATQPEPQPEPEPEPAAAATQPETTAPSTSTSQQIKLTTIRKPKVETAPAPAAVVPDTPVADSPTPTKSAPRPLTPPEGSAPSVHTSALEIPPAATAPALVATPQATAAATGGLKPAVQIPTKKPGLSNAQKTVIAGILGLIVVFLAWLILNKIGENRQTAIYNAILAEAAPGDATKADVNAEGLEILLRAVANPGANEERHTIYKALFLAKATDGTDVDARIAEFATTQAMLPDIRETLIRDVLRKRKNPAVVPTLMAYARTATETRDAVAALQAVRFMSGDKEFPSFIEVIQQNPEPEIRKAAEDNAAQIIVKSDNRDQYAETIARLYEESVDEDTRHRLLRLLGHCGGTKALEVLKSNLDSEKSTNQIAALTAIGSWGDDDAYPLLISFLATNKDARLRDQAFKAVYRFLTNPKLERKSNIWKSQWLDLQSQIRTREETETFIRNVTPVPELWTYDIVKAYTKSEDDRINDLAGRAVEYVLEGRRSRGEPIPGGE